MKNYITMQRNPLQMNKEPLLVFAENTTQHTS